MGSTRNQLCGVMYFWQCILVSFFISAPIQFNAALSPCFEEGITWYADDVLDLTFGVQGMFDCQAGCSADSACEAFTWNTAGHSHYPKLCTKFHTTMRQEECKECVSGPDDCTCSAEYGCDITEDNMVDSVPGVETELECMELCYHERSCEMYTWFDEGNIYRHFCFLFKYCWSQDFECDDCFSGPPVCDSTTTPYPRTTTTPYAPTTTTPYAPTSTTPYPRTTTTPYPRTTPWL